MLRQLTSVFIVALCTAAAVPAPVVSPALGLKSVGGSLLNACTPEISGGLGPNNVGLSRVKQQQLAISLLMRANWYLYQVDSYPDLADN
jgi:hypothetical protein